MFFGCLFIGCQSGEQKDLEDDVSNNYDSDNRDSDYANNNSYENDYEYNENNSGSTSVASNEDGGNYVNNQSSNQNLLQSVEDDPAYAAGYNDYSNPDDYIAAGEDAQNISNMSNIPSSEPLFEEQTAGSGYQEAISDSDFNAAATAPVTENELQGRSMDVLSEEAPEEASGVVSSLSPSVRAGAAGGGVSRSYAESLNPVIPDGRTRKVPSPPDGYEGDLRPVISDLVWLGYDYRPEESQVRIEMVTDGMPKYSLYTTINRYNLPEVVVRFYQTHMRGRILRDIDASEFGAPISYIRTFFHSRDYFTDVILTLRESSSMRLYVNEGNLLATFPISEKYYGNHEVGDAAVEYAKVMDYSPMYAEFLESSEFPKGVNPYDLTRDAFSGAPADGGAEVFNDSMVPSFYSEDGLPQQDFDNSSVIEEERKRKNVETNHSLQQSDYNESLTKDVFYVQKTSQQMIHFFAGSVEVISEFTCLHARVQNLAYEALYG